MVGFTFPVIHITMSHCSPPYKFHMIDLVPVHRCSLLTCEWDNFLPQNSVYPILDTHSLGFRFPEFNNSCTVSLIPQLLLLTRSKTNLIETKTTVRLPHLVGRRSAKQGRVRMGLTVNWYLAKKLVVNWELGTPQGPWVWNLAAPPARDL